MATQIQLPPGRIVEGNVYKSSTIGMNGQVKAKPEFYFAVAVAKNDPQLPGVFGAYLAEAQSSYAPHRHILGRIQQINFGNQFAWKIADGDAPDRRERAGQAGCWIFKFKTTWDIKVVDANNQPINAAILRTGFWCDVLANLAGNGKLDHTAGLYTNPVFVRWLFQGYGDEIFPGPQADKAMGAAPTQLPPGAQPQQGGSFQPGGSGPSQGSMAGTYPGQAPSHAPNVGYQAPAATQGQAPGGWQQPQVNPQYPATGNGGQGAAPTPGNAPNGGQGGGNPQNPAAHAGHAAPGQHQPSSGQAHGNVPNATTYPSSGPTPQPGGPASGPAAQANAPQSAPAVPAGAHYTQAQPASPTAYPGSPPVHGFAHGNPATS
ncbi:MAG TPA: hypothetical protein VMT30_02530 [Candidatus Saccharimonadia bacterium]|nr:hypothetical protein [Candidatus Saccharimonadia bacterium]